MAVALKTMTDAEREVVWHHYVARCYDLANGRPLARPVKQALVAARLGLSLANYYQRRDRTKSMIRTALTLDTKVIHKARSSVLDSEHLGSERDPET